MALRKAEALTVRPAGLTDAVDGTNAMPGGMAVLQDLIPDPSTASVFVCRPASVQTSNFSGFTTPAQGEALLVVGTTAYGFIASDRFPGKSEPFSYDLLNGTFATITNVTAANCPTTQSTTGEWVPPTVTNIANRIIFTHPGYDGITYFIGWLDQSSFASTGVTGTTHTSTLIDALSSDVITINGWQVGQAISGAGIPADTYIASIAANGLSITLSQATIAGAPGVALTVAGGTLAAPIYGAGNTSPIALTARPNTAGQFNTRAYYGVANAAVLSDALQPTQVSGDGGTFVPVVTLGDNTDITALVGLPLTNQVSGGTTQSLIAFKGAGPFFQITGDPATATAGAPLITSEVNGSVGTLAPNTICGSPTGLYYIAPDGLREISLVGVCSDPIGADGDGVSVPFLNAGNPSRMAAAFNGNVLRVSLQNDDVDGQPFQEYWFHKKRKIWTGPHSFPASLIQPYPGSVAGNAFILFAQGVNGALWEGYIVPTQASSYTENGVALNFAYQTVLLPDNAKMAGNQMVETSLAVALPNLENLSILVQDEEGNQLDQISLAGDNSGGSIWDAFTWGSAVWGSSVPPFEQHSLPWNLPLIFKQASIRIAGRSMANFKIGNLYLKYQILGYLLK